MKTQLLGTEITAGFKWKKPVAFCGVALLLISGFFFGHGCRQEVRNDGLGLKINLEYKKLSNGLQVILIEDHTLPIVSYQTWFKVGSVDEKPGSTGLAHLFEHLMFKGTPKFGPKQIFHQLEAKGAEVNAFTTRDYTVYYENFISSLLPKVIEIESDRMNNLTLTQEILNSERQVVFEERHLRTENTPGGKTQEALWQMAFSRHPYRNPVIGYPEDLASLTLEKMTAFYKDYYRPNNAAVIVAGDIKSKEVFDMIQKAYGHLPSGKIPKRDFEKEPEQEGERRLVMYEPTPSERFTYAYHVPSAHDDDAYALDVLSNILFEGTSSRAYRRLTEERDIAWGVGGSNFTPTYPGLFIIGGTMRGNLSTSLAEAEMDRLISDVQTTPVKEKEIQAAVRQLTVQLVDSVRTQHGLAQLIGTVTMILEDPKKYSDDIKKYTRVTAADVKRVAEKYLLPNNRTVITVMPEKKKAAK